MIVGFIYASIVEYNMMFYLMDELIRTGHVVYSFSTHDVRPLNERVYKSTIAEPRDIYDVVEPVLKTGIIDVWITINDMGPYGTPRELFDSGKPTVLLQGGVKGYDHAISMKERGMVFQSEYVFVGGEHDKHFYMEGGVPEEKIRITGLPHLSGVGKPPQSKEVLREAFGLPKNEKIILWANRTHTRFPEEDVESAEWLEELSKKYYVITKLHPTEIEHSVYDRDAFERVFVRTANLTNLIYISDVLVTHTSCCGLDAMLLGVPVVQNHPGHCKSGKYRTGYADFGGAFHGRNKQEFLESVDRALDGEALDFNGCLSRMGYTQPDPATRVIEELKKIVGEL